MTTTQNDTRLRTENTYHWPPNGESRPWMEFWVTTFTAPVGAAVSASILYCVDESDTWQHRPMERNCVLGEHDVWHVNLGSLPAGTRVRYAVEGVNAQGQSTWDNVCGLDHHALIGSPKDGIPTHQAP